MKKWLALSLALMMLLVQLVAFAEDSSASFDVDDLEIDGNPPPMTDESDAAGGLGTDPFANTSTTGSLFGTDADANARVLHVANTTPLNGEFFSDLWGNATSDMDVRTLLHGYNLIRWDGEAGQYLPDESVASGFVAVEDEEGNHSFIIALYEDLMYSDGSAITAWDYAFSILLSISPEIAELGGNPKDMSYLLGYKEYMDGTRNYLTGVNVLSDHQLMITLNHEFLPYFYEVGLLSTNPYPISVIAPGVKVADDGLGVYLTNEDESEEEPVFNEELLEDTIMDPDIGYLSHPSVVSGPYVLDDFDGETATFSANPYYKGNYRGLKPQIRKISFTSVTNEEMIEQLKDGSLDLANKVTRAEVIRAGMAAMTDNLAMANYPRQGLSFISFNTERPIVSSLNVRKAIALCMDKDALVSDYVGYYGLRVDGFYGIGQWMYTMLNGRGASYITPPPDYASEAERSAYNDEVAQWNNLNLDGLTIYNLDVERAKKLLIEDGWTLNEDGSSYTEIPATATDLDKAGAGIRYKEIDGELVPLSLTMVYPEGNQMASAMEEHFLPYLQQAGIELTLEPVSMMEVLLDYYQSPDATDTEDARDCDMIYLATNFSLLYDPEQSFLTDSEGNISWNFTNLVDDEFYQLAHMVSKTSQGDTLTYAQRWVAYQVRFSQILPAIPVYSNVYFDFYTGDLQNYSISSSTSWAEAIMTASFKEEEVPEEEVVPTATPEPEEEVDHSGGVSFG